MAPGVGMWPGVPLGVVFSVVYAAGTDFVLFGFGRGRRAVGTYGG